jgi:hypothetical protein
MWSDVAGPDIHLDIDTTVILWLLQSDSGTDQALDDMTRHDVGFVIFRSCCFLQLQNRGSWSCWCKGWLWSDVAAPGIRSDINTTGILWLLQ